MGFIEGNIVSKQFHILVLTFFDKKHPESPVFALKMPQMLKKQWFFVKNSFGVVQTRYQRFLTEQRGD